MSHRCQRACSQIFDSGDSIQTTFGNRAAMSREPSVDCWSWTSTTSQNSDRQASVCGSTHASFFTGSSAMTFIGSRRPVEQRPLNLPDAEAAARPRIVETLSPCAEQELPDEWPPGRRRQPIQLEQPVTAVRKEQRAIFGGQRVAELRAIGAKQIQNVIGGHGEMPCVALAGMTAIPRDRLTNDGCRPASVDDGQEK